MKYGLIDTDISFTAEQASILEKYDKNTYFTQEESQFIIKYLMNCLVYNEPLDCFDKNIDKWFRAEKDSRCKECKRNAYLRRKEKQRK